MAAHHSTPLAVLDLLNSLLEAQSDSIFRFLEAGAPYMEQASASLVRPIRDMMKTSHTEAQELIALIQFLGGEGIAPRLRPQDQYLSYLSFKFLLPKLINEKHLTIERYQSAQTALASIDNVPPRVPALLARHLAQHQSDVAQLEQRA